MIEATNIYRAVHLIKILEDERQAVALELLSHVLVWVTSADCQGRMMTCETLMHSLARVARVPDNWTCWSRFERAEYFCELLWAFWWRVYDNEAHFFHLLDIFVFSQFLNWLISILLLPSSEAMHTRCRFPHCALAPKQTHEKHLSFKRCFFKMATIHFFASFCPWTKVT